MIQAVNSPKNMIPWSMEPNRVPPWTLDQITVPSINNASPDGSLSASILHEDANAGTHFLYCVQPVSCGRVYCLSVVAKAINRTWMNLYFDGFGVFVNLATGAIGTVVGASLNRIVTALPNSWYRISYAYLSPTNANVYVRCYIGEADNDVTFNGLNQDSLYIWKPCINDGYYPEDLEKIYTNEVAKS